jgi:hypothetical protein
MAMRNGKPVWQYKDARGVDCTGVMEKFTDFGGTDITYWFRREDGTLDLVSGQRLKDAKRIWD